MQRHNLVYLNSNATLVYNDKKFPRGVTEKIRGMLVNGLPFVFTMQKDRTGLLSIATSIIDQEEKYRVALQVSLNDVKKISLPIDFSLVRDLLSVQERYLSEAFINDMSDLECSVHVYGSFANQYLSGEVFINNKSDIDLLLIPKRSHLIPQILAAFERFSARMILRLDGELVIPGKNINVSILELLNSKDNPLNQVIAKNNYEASLVCVKSILL